MAGNPYGYGQVHYDSAKPPEKKREFKPGDLVAVRGTKIVGRVIADWKDYGLQIEHLDGPPARRLYHRDRLEDAVLSLLEVLARVSV